MRFLFFQRVSFAVLLISCLFFFQAEDGIRDLTVTGVQTCALPICRQQSLLVCPWSTWRRRTRTHGADMTVTLRNRNSRGQAFALSFSAPCSRVQRQDRKSVV